MIKSAVILLAAISAPTWASAQEGLDGQTVINQVIVLATGGFPYKITRPGSYRLSGNLTVTGAVDAIDIRTGNVTLDLNGFSIIGPLVCSGTPAQCAGSAGNGITGAAVSGFVTVKNGYVQGFQQGVILNSPANAIDLEATGNRLLGIALLNSGSIVRCQASFNNSDGFQGVFASISDSTAIGNGNSGFSLKGANLSHSVARLNGGFGVLVNGGTVIGNFVDSNSIGVQFLLNQPNTLFGSNTVVNNNGRDVVGIAGAISQNNNVCTNGSC